MKNEYFDNEENEDDELLCDDWKLIIIFIVIEGIFMFMFLCFEI
ncbi:hypothetical protein [Clostridium sp. DL1XJH146]